MRKKTTPIIMYDVWIWSVNVKIVGNIAMYTNIYYRRCTLFVVYIQNAVRIPYIHICASSLVHDTCSKLWKYIAHCLPLNYIDAALTSSTNARSCICGCFVFVSMRIYARTRLDSPNQIRMNITERNQEFKWFYIFV